MKYHEKIHLRYCKGASLHILHKFKDPTFYRITFHPSCCKINLKCCEYMVTYIFSYNDIWETKPRFCQLIPIYSFIYYTYNYVYLAYQATKEILDTKIMLIFEILHLRKNSRTLKTIYIYIFI